MIVPASRCEIRNLLRMLFTSAGISSPAARHRRGGILNGFQIVSRLLLVGRIAPLWCKIKPAAATTPLRRLGVGEAVAHSIANHRGRGHRVPQIVSAPNSTRRPRSPMAAIRHRIVPAKGGARKRRRSLKSEIPSIGRQGRPFNRSPCKTQCRQIDFNRSPLT